MCSSFLNTFGTNCVKFRVFLFHVYGCNYKIETVKLLTISQLLYLKQLLECLYESLGKGGYEKKYILSNMKIFISKCEEETRWWKAVKRRCKEVVGDKPSMDLEEFKRLLSFEVISFVALSLVCKIEVL